MRQQKLLWTLPEENADIFQLLEFSRDGSKLWLCNRGEEFICVDIKTQAQTRYPLPERLEDDTYLYRSSYFRCCMEDGKLYITAEDLYEGTIHLVTFDTHTEQFTLTEAFTPTSDASGDSGEIMVVHNGSVYLWEASAAAVYKVDPAAGEVEVFLEDMTSRPVLQFLDDEGSYLLCCGSSVTLYQPDGQEVFSAALEDQTGVSGYLTDGQLLLLTDAGNITRFDLSGQKLGEIACNIYTSFATNLSLNYEPEEIVWTETADGDLFVNLFNAGNLIDRDTWQLRTWVPNCVAYIPAVNQVVATGRLTDSANDKMGSFPLYSLEDIKAMAEKALNGYTLTREQKEWYGIS